LTGTPVTQAKSSTNEADLRQGLGPQVPNSGSDVAKSQDDVDDLLASLGF
jgi:chemotaxis protein CheZ